MMQLHEMRGALSTLTPYSCCLSTAHEMWEGEGKRKQLYTVQHRLEHAHKVEQFLCRSIICLTEMSV